MCTASRRRHVTVTDTLIPTPAEYSGLPKRTSRGTSSASAAENFMAVRVWGRLRGGVKAAADAMRIAASLSILKRMIRAYVFGPARQRHYRLGLVQLSSASSSCGFRAQIAGFGARPIETKRVQEDECLKSVCWGHARPSETPAWLSTHIAWLIAVNFRWIQRHVQDYTYRTSAVHILLLITRRVRATSLNARDLPS